MDGLLARPHGNDAPPATSARPGRRRNKRAAKAAERGPAFIGWLSSDEEEIERRRWRARTENLAVESLDAEQPIFGTFRVRSPGSDGAGSSYEVEIRSLDRPLNSCGCADHRVNGLGTCKHIEAVLTKLRRRGAKPFETARRLGSPRVELFLARAGEAAPRLLWPADSGLQGGPFPARALRRAGTGRRGPARRRHAGNDRGHVGGDRGRRARGPGADSRLPPSGRLARSRPAPRRARRGAGAVPGRCRAGAADRRRAAREAAAVSARRHAASRVR